MSKPTFAPFQQAGRHRFGGAAGGVYRFDSSAQLTGVLSLNTAGNPTGTFIFQIGSTLITASNSAVTLLGAADPNIFWQVGSSATLGTGTAFDGNILAHSSITLTTVANIPFGKALANEPTWRGTNASFRSRFRLL